MTLKLTQGHRNFVYLTDHFLLSTSGF